MKIVEWKQTLSNTQPTVNHAIQTDTHRLSVGLQYVQGITADQRIRTTNNNKVGPCKLTTQMFKPTADQKRAYYS